jgi:hypothetical protein
MFSVSYKLNVGQEERMKKIALIMAGLAAIFVTINLKSKIEKWMKEREAEDLASKAF